MLERCSVTHPANEDDLLRRITSNPDVFGGKPTIRNRRLAVEHVLGMLAAGDTPEVLLQGYPCWSPTTFVHAGCTPGAWPATNALSRSSSSRRRREGRRGYTGTMPKQAAEQLDPESLVARIIAELEANPVAQRMLLRAMLTNEFLGMPVRLRAIERDVAEIRGDVAVDGSPKTA